MIARARIRVTAHARDRYRERLHTRAGPGEIADDARAAGELIPAGRGGLFAVRAGVVFVLRPACDGWVMLTVFADGPEFRAKVGRRKPALKEGRPS